MTIDYQALRLDKESAEPLHLQLGRELRRQIKGIAPNQKVKLISERKLAELLAVDRSTVHRTYTDLLDFGFLVRNSARSLRVATDARQKQRQPFPNIGIVIPERFSDFVVHNGQVPMYYLNGVFDRTAELNYSTILLKLPPPETEEAVVQEYLEELAGRLNGIIHLGDRGVTEDRTLRMLLECSGIPQVFISGYSHLAHIGSVVGDVATGARSLCEQLRELRHRKVGMIALPEYNKRDPNQLFHYDVFDRLAGMAAIFREYFMQCEPQWQLSNWKTEAELEQWLAALVAADDLPTVFCCTNDFRAQRTIASLRKLGLRVPEDVSVVGCDGEEADGLTTIRVPFYAIGCRAVDAVREYYTSGIHGANRIVKIPTSLQLRETLGVARMDNFRLKANHCFAK